MKPQTGAYLDWCPLEEDPCGVPHWLVGSKHCYEASQEKARTNFNAATMKWWSNRSASREENRKLEKTLNPKP